MSEKEKEMLARLMKLAEELPREARIAVVNRVEGMAEMQQLMKKEAVR